MKFIEEYSKLEPLYVDYTIRIISLLKSILESSSIDYHLIEGRAKTLKSFEEKIKREGKNYSDPLAEITDLSGLRIIIYYQKDISRVEELLKTNFQIDPENSIDKSSILKDNEFGYLSNHYVIKLNDNRNCLPEWSAFKNFNCEIQLRTVLQHSWAAISHELQYKNKFDIPNILKRRLYRLAGLFELADEEFGAVKAKQLQLTEAIENRDEIENQRVYDEINLNTIQNFFERERHLVEEFRIKAKDAGFGFAKNTNKDNENYFSELTEIASLLNINTIEEFKRILTESVDNSYGLFKTLFDDQPIEKGEKRAWLASHSFLVILILLSHLKEEKLLEFKGKRWSNDILNRVKGSIVKWKTKTANKG